MSDRVTWLRDERQKAYAGLSIAGEEALQFIRSELPTLIGSSGAGQRDDVDARWRELRTELRKAYNQVALFGADGRVRRPWVYGEPHAMEETTSSAPWTLGICSRR